MSKCSEVRAGESRDVCWMFGIVTSAGGRACGVGSGGDMAEIKVAEASWDWSVSMIVRSCILYFLHGVALSRSVLVE